MPEKKTIEKAKRALKQGKRPSTAAGEFVREEIDHVRQGKHGARSTKQAIAIGLSKARRSGVPLKAPARGQATERTRRSAERDYEAGKEEAKTTSRRAPSKARRAPARSSKRAAASKRALEREPRAAASPRALSRQAKSAAARRKSRSSASRAA